MVDKVAALSDRLLARLVPRVDAQAQQCQYCGYENYHGVRLYCCTYYCPPDRPPRKTCRAA